MSPIYKLCSKHKALYQGKCPACYKADNLRRSRKQQAAGRTSAHWQKLKRLAKEAAGYRCQTCGRAEEPTPAGWLDVHLRDEYRHLSHAQVTSTEQVAVTCKFCHGSHHAPEAAATRGPGSLETPRGPARPAPTRRERNCPL